MYEFPVIPAEVPKALMQQHITKADNANAADLRSIERLEGEIADLRAGIAIRDQALIALRAALAKLEG